jgi:hypothetical protein
MPLKRACRKAGPHASTPSMSVCQLGVGPRFIRVEEDEMAAARVSSREESRPSPPLLKMEPVSRTAPAFATLRPVESEQDVLFP